ncbi:hypothetical protein GQ600_20034 [Phytophthora cactorum]|nr:hypothetical protein GQ600_20034 [Phytophthora cactorum]
MWEKSISLVCGCKTPWRVGSGGRYSSFETNWSSTGRNGEEHVREGPQSNVKLLHAPQLWAKGVKGKNVVSPALTRAYDTPTRH